ncbi:MAG: PAS domain S-box protein [Anaerolineae bacterium]|jgi:PAS domain S-box-containing protein
MGGQPSAAGEAVELDKEMDLLQAIMENTVAHLAYLDPEYNYVRVNSVYAQGAGYHIEELVGRNHFDLFPHSENRALFEQVRDSGEPANFQAMPIEFPEQMGRGTTFWDWSLVPVKDGAGHVHGLVLSSTEVTDQERARQENERLKDEVEQYAERLEQMVIRRTAALQASEARFRTIFEDSVFGIALLEVEGRIVASNSALEAILGYGEADLSDTVLTDYAYPDDAEAGRDLFETLASGDLGYYQVDTRYVRGDGEVRWCELTVSRIERAREGMPWLAIAMVEDITEKRLNQQALLRAERLAIAGRLGASLAHEINNPLQSVIGCLGLAEEMLDEGAEVRNYLEIAMEELERAADIVTQLRDLSRKPGMKKEPVDLNALIEKVLLLTRKRCQARSVEVAWSPATGLPKVLVAPDRIQQVFLNLVLNAAEAMPEAGRLQVSTALTGEPAKVRVAVADTGVGIEPERLAEIFEPLHSSRPEGLGLGLYISKSIVEEHGGHIDVDSQVGKGTTFTVWLPA